MEAMQTPAGVIYDATVMPALCLDLDGTVRHSKQFDFIRGANDVALFPDVEAVLWEYRNEGYLIFGLSNQGGVAHEFKSVEDVVSEMDAMLALFTHNPFHLIKQCYHHETGRRFPYNHRSLLRKPGIGMLALMEVEAFDAGYVVDWNRSLLVGDRPEDEECAQNARIPFQWAEAFFRR